MRFNIQREDLLIPLQHVTGVVERKQTLPILGNLLLEVQPDRLAVTGTDLEVELVAYAGLEGADPGRTTVSARKLLDICRSLPEQAAILFEREEDRMRIRSGRSRFVLTTRPADEFPNVESGEESAVLTLPCRDLRRLIEHTHFAMALQDVRYFLIGLLLEVEGTSLRAVATDGHRMAYCETELPEPLEMPLQVIVPRKGVLELMRLLSDDEAPARVQLGTNHIRVELGDVLFTSKLIDGKYPDYERVLAVGGDKQLIADTDLLRQALQRASILSSERFRGVRLQLKENLLRAITDSPEHEIAEEELLVNYNDQPLDVGFNVRYLIDALAALDSEEVRISLSNADRSCLVEAAPEGGSCRYVIMPMRL